MNQVFIRGVGLAAAGLADWHSAQPVLRGERVFEPEALVSRKTGLLPANEARRAGARVRLAFQAAEQACIGVDASRLPTVFASEVADTSITDRICRDIIDPDRSVSPTQFHNSVHNTAAGYWSIAVGSQSPANSLSGGPDCFALALMEAWGLLAEGWDDVLLVCFEHKGEAENLLDRARKPIYASCALALRLSSKPGPGAFAFSRPGRTTAGPTRMVDDQLERFRQQNPAARGLPLLAAIAGNRAGCLVLECSQGNLAMETACARA